MMDHYIIDFTKLDRDYNFWKLIRDSLDLPEWFGENPDALWDMVTGYIDAPMKITAIGLETLPDSLTTWRTWFREVMESAAADPIWQVEYEERMAK